jgi:hypothetical protein
MEKNKTLSASTIIICGIVRDCGKNLEKNIRTVAALCAMAKDYRVVIFENDSKDNSKQILRRWADRNGKVYVSLNDFGTVTIPPKTDAVIPAFSTARIGKMANYRNFYLDYIEQNNIEGDYVVIVDFDIRKIELKGIINSFSLNYEWDAITANGISYAPSAFFRRRFYDTYAFVECGQENIPQTEENIKAAQYRWAFLKAGMPPIRVASAFGGLAIYRREAIEGCRYGVLLNNDEKVESRAEHYFFHRQMAERGFDKIFVNPSMTVRYQTQIWNTIKRIFGGNHTFFV